jgi:hypothetical protein
VPDDLKHLGLAHDEQRFQEFTTVAREMGLSQSAAQRLVDLHLRQKHGH